jgi:hypothetical protein
MRSRRFLILFLLVACPAFAARQITTQIHDVDMGTNIADEILVFLKSGDVARLKPGRVGLLESLQKNKSPDQWLTLTVDNNRYIQKIEDATLPPYSLGVDEILGPNLDAITYVPTTIANMKTARDYIAESRHPSKPETQCFNRAMVWSYEWWRKHSLKSNRVFVFWPKEYVRRYTFKWWFHVSPYVHVKDDDGKVKERVMDVKWLSHPYEFQAWADYHSIKDVKCKIVKKYSEYADNPFDSNRCYFIRANMFTWQPADLEMKEAWGYTKEAFNMDEVKSAYLEAFDIYL